MAESLDVLGLRRDLHRRQAEAYTARVSLPRTGARALSGTLGPMATRSLVMITAAIVGFTSWTVGCGPKSDDAKTSTAVEAGIAPTAALPTDAERSPARRADLAAPSGSSPPEAHAPLTEIDQLCATIDHDYVDGTLSTTFRGVALRSPAGQRLLAAAKTADQPGRHVLAAARSAAPDLAPAELANCRKLDDYIDDVE